MKLRINNKETETAATSLAELSAELALPEKGVAVAVNNRMIPRADWAATPLAADNHILIIKAACGG